MYLNLGNSSFQSALNDEYVDKSQIISEFNSRIDKKSKLICVSRPRRFGKSLMAQMLCAYYDKTCDSLELFNKLAISKDKSFKENLNKYPVIYLDMTWFVSNCGDVVNVLSYMQYEVISELKKSYPNASGTTLSRFIASAATTYNEKFIIIIDEWDAIFREAKNYKQIQEGYVMLLQGLFKSPLTDNMFSLVYMTGILPIKKYGTQSALTDFREYTMLLPEVFAPYTGFTENEVKQLCEKHGRNFEDAKKWYDGYSFENIKSIYNPNSIMRSMTSGVFASYWTRSETYEALKLYIDMDFDGTKQAIIELLGNEEVVIDPGTFQNDITTLNSKDDVLTLLVHFGYLAFDSKTSAVYIPNEEVRQEFVRAVKNGSRKDLAKMIKESDYLIENTLEGNENEVAKAIELAHESGISPLFYNNEQALRSVIKFAYISAIDDYVQIQELPSGKGYADIVFVPKDTSNKPAMIIELKWNKSSDSAIEQIKNNNYPQTIKELFGDIVLVGINYDEKSKKHDCKIERIQR